MTTNLERLQERFEKARKELQEANRKADLRKKVIIGTCVLAAQKKGVLGDDWLKKLLHNFLTSKSDREFMGLAPTADSSINPPPAPPPAPHQYQEGA